MRDHVEARGLFLVFLNCFNSYYYDDLLGIVDLHYTLNIVDVSIVVKPLATSPITLMYSFFPFSPHHCFGTPPVIINQYIDGKWIRDGNFFPPKDMNLFGCPLILATWEDKPYIRMTVDDFARNKVVPAGIEGRMYEYMSFKLNFKLEYYWMNKKESETALSINDSFFADVSY